MNSNFNLFSYNIIGKEIPPSENRVLSQFFQKGSYQACKIAGYLLLGVVVVSIISITLKEKR